MNKIFLYLYPIKEFADVFFLGNEYYDANNFQRPFDVLNEARSLTVVFYHNMYLSLLKQGIQGVKNLAFFCCEMVV